MSKSSFLCFKYTQEQVDVIGFLSMSAKFRVYCSQFKNTGSFNNEMKEKVVNFCKKLENKLRYVIIYFFLFCDFFYKNFFFDNRRIKIFHKK